MSQIIALTGKARAGKNTVAKVIASVAKNNGHSHCERGFTDLMKLSVSSLFQSDPNGSAAWVEVFKLYGSVTMDIWGNGETTQMTGRQFLQRYGTEAHRDVFGTDFWTKALLPSDWQTQFNSADICTITDLRFDSEAERVKELGGVVIRVQREKPIPGANKYEDLHSSEAPISNDLVDATINNYGDVEELCAEVTKVLGTYIV